MRYEIFLLCAFTTGADFAEKRVWILHIFMQELANGEEHKVRVHMYIVQRAWFMTSTNSLPKNCLAWINSFNIRIFHMFYSFYFRLHVCVPVIFCLPFLIPSRSFSLIHGFVACGMYFGWMLCFRKRGIKKWFSLSLLILSLKISNCYHTYIQPKYACLRIFHSPNNNLWNQRADRGRKAWRMGKIDKT